MTVVRRFVLGIVVCLALGTSVGITTAQEIPGLEVTFYGYFPADDPESVLLVGELTSDVPGLAAEFVSPDNVNAFFDGYTSFTNYDFASDLPAAYIDQIDEADEYMVFAGDSTLENRTQPAYVMLLSASEKVFMIQGFEPNADDLFALAALTIAEGEAPEQFEDYVRVLTSATGDDSGSAPNTSPGGQQTEDDLNVFCSVDPNLGVVDLNDDGLITVEELSNFTGIEGIDTLISSMQDNGFDAVQYRDC